MQLQHVFQPTLWYFSTSLLLSRVSNFPNTTQASTNYNRAPAHLVVLLQVAVGHLRCALLHQLHAVPRVDVLVLHLPALLPGLVHLQGKHTCVHAGREHT